jgi:uncharacterized glyoxalase superfamily protein PhnB
MTLDHSAPAVYPIVRYDDAPAAIKYLIDVFGFTEELVVPGEGNTVEHAQLGWQHGMIMLGTRVDGDPFQSGPCTVYLAVDDPDAHHARSVAAGAEIIMGLTDQPYGSREYAARDPEGTVWCFGTYQPAPKAVSDRLAEA